jgi:hypothetical protein
MHNVLDAIDKASIESCSIIWSTLSKRINKDAPVIGFKPYAKGTTLTIFLIFR